MSKNTRYVIITAWSSSRAPTPHESPVLLYENNPPREEHRSRTCHWNIIRLIRSACRDLPWCRVRGRLNKFISTVVYFPKTLVILKSFKIEGLNKFRSAVVIYPASAVKLIFVPLSFVGQTAVVVVQSAKTVHSVVLPLSDIVPSIFVVKCSLTVALVVVDKSAVSTSVLVLFLSVLSELLFLLFGLGLAFLWNGSVEASFYRGVVRSVWSSGRWLLLGAGSVFVVSLLWSLRSEAHRFFVRLFSVVVVLDNLTLLQLKILPDLVDNFNFKCKFWVIFILIFLICR